jgi:Cd2+/Zn2+-exporting ATPase
MMISNQYKLEGLTCANCAGKIEKRMTEIEGFEDVSLNFTTQTLTFKAVDEDYQKMIQSEVNAIEDGVTVYHKHAHIHHYVDEAIHEHHHDHGHSHGEDSGIGIWIRLGIGGSLFAAGLLMTLDPTMELLVFLVAYLTVGGDVLLRAVKNIMRGHVFDENFLMSVATIGAFAIGEYPEGVTVMLFYQIGELFQDMAVKQSRASIESLMDIRPDVAWIKRDGQLTSVAAASVEVGETIVVKPGERIPLDGGVTSGNTMLDTSALTGESVPRSAGEGDDVLSGSVNQTGLIEIKVSKAFGDSTVSKILDMVENATNKKAETEKFITKFARYYTPAVVYMALALAIIPPLLIEGATFSSWIHRALIFLVVSCPCALVISIPLGFFGGIGGASRHGILIKGSNYLEALKSVETVVFDKTGTLTKGVFQVKDIHPVVGTESTLIQKAAMVECHSNHPIAKSILKAYGKTVTLDAVSDLDEVAGKGLVGMVKGKRIAAGNLKLMASVGVEAEEVNQAGTVVYLAEEGVYLGYILIADEVKSDSKSAIKALKSMGVKEVVMLTGDHRAVADAVAAEIGIDQVHSELLPHEKVEKLEEILERTSGKTVFVGDGINDAPVLARADIGVAMGGVGSDAAIEAADVVLMTDEPSKLVDSLKVAKRTNRIVWQNIAFAMGVKGLVLILGAGGLATMWEAVFADVGVALIAIVNAMRIIRKPI